MNFERPNNLENLNTKVEISAEKQEILDKIEIEVDQIADRLGKPIDVGIRDTVIYAKALGLETDGSCEGHPKIEGEVDNHVPYIDFEASGRPDYRVEDGEDIIQKCLDKYGVTMEDVREEIKPDAANAWNEAWEEIDGRDASQQYKEWLARNRAMFQRVKELLHEFYQNSDSEMINPEDRLILWGANDGFFRVTNDADIIESDEEGNNYYKKDKDIEGSEEEIAKKVARWQEEMVAFTKFLKNKFLKS